MIHIILSLRFVTTYNVQEFVTNWLILASSIIYTPSFKSISYMVVMAY